MAVVGGAGRLAIGEYQVMRLVHDAGESSAQIQGTLDIGVASSDGVIVISVVGELNDSNHHSLRTCFGEISGEGSPDVILDVEHLALIDLAGFSLLAECQNRIEAAGGTFSILAPTHVIERLFHGSVQLPHRMIEAVAV